jgi:hypothetical protein
MSETATRALVVVLACVAGVALMIGIVSLLTATLGGNSGSDEISIPYAAAWTGVALAVLGFAVAIPFFPRLRIQLVAVTAAWAMGLIALIAAGGMRDDRAESAGGDGRPCAKLALEASSDVELSGESCDPKPQKRRDR